MSTKLLSSAGQTRVTPKADAAAAQATKAAERLESLTAADMPWLSQEGRAAFADAQEVSGPPIYKKPFGWR
jgi:hypothetical protein